MPLSMSEWDKSVGHHLKMIEAGAQMCERHAMHLVAMPEFETLALEELKHAEELTQIVQATLRNARELMEGKPRVA